MAECITFESVREAYLEYMTDLGELNNRYPGRPKTIDEPTDLWFDEARALNTSDRRELVPMFLAGLYCAHECEVCPINVRLQTLTSEQVVELKLSELTRGE